LQDLGRAVDQKPKDHEGQRVAGNDEQDQPIARRSLSVAVQGLRFIGSSSGGHHASAYRLIEVIAPDAANHLRFIDFLEGMVTSISQVFVKGNGIAALISVIVAHLLGAESQLITAGLVGFNPILTAVAVGTVFNRPGLRSALFTLLATVLTVLVHGAMVAALTPFAIPTLTASFVLVTWLFLLAKPDLAATLPPSRTA
jgi:urea transporter